jgi:metal iron transporter
MVVAVAVGRSGVNTLLVASQVVLSIVLPFIILPLLFLTSSKSIMSVRKPRSISTDVPSGEAAATSDTEAAMETVDFSNNKLTIVIGFVIWLAILIANMYVIVELAMGQGG